MSRARHVHGGTEKHTEIITKGRMSRKCHAYHHYQIYIPSPGKVGITEQVAQIHFQCGPIKEAGENGCSNEDLLAIVLDRLQCLQAGKFPCKHNSEAVRHVRVALAHLNDRTKDREKRGVEGRNKA